MESEYDWFIADIEDEWSCYESEMQGDNAQEFDNISLTL